MPWLQLDVPAGFWGQRDKCWFTGGLLGNSASLISYTQHSLFLPVSYASVPTRPSPQSLVTEGCVCSPRPRDVLKADNGIFWNYNRRHFVPPMVMGWDWGRWSMRAEPWASRAWGILQVGETPGTTWSNFIWKGMEESKLQSHEKVTKPVWGKLRPEPGSTISS